MRAWSLAVLVLIGVGPWAAPPASGPACPETPGQRVLDLVNAERARQGLAPFRVNLRLHAAALAHARDLASGPDAGHVGSDGSDPARRADRAGYAWIRIGENVSAGQASPEEVVDGWMKSTPHRHSILDRDFQEAAVALEPRMASRWGVYWVMVFGARDDPDVYREEECNP